MDLFVFILLILGFQTLWNVLITKLFNCREIDFWESWLLMGFIMYVRDPDSFHDKPNVQN